MKLSKLMYAIMIGVAVVNMGVVPFSIPILQMFLSMLLVD